MDGEIKIQTAEDQKIGVSESFGSAQDKSFGVAQDEPMPVVSRPEPEKEMYVWGAPARPYKKRTKEFFTTVATLALLLSVILILAREFLLVGVIGAFAFVAYVLASVPPGMVTHKITNKGLRTELKLYLWSQLGRFWWEDKWKQKVLNVELPLQFPGKLQLVLGEGDQKQIEEHFSKYLVKQKPEPTWLDNASKWLQEKVPLENE